MKCKEHLQVIFSGLSLEKEIKLTLSINLCGLELKRKNFSFNRMSSYFLTGYRKKADLT